jgi:hypothetical protein
MTRPEKVACAPGDSRCYVFPDPLDDARLTCTPKGVLHWLDRRHRGRDRWDVWLDVHTGEGR